MAWRVAAPDGVCHTPRPTCGIRAPELSCSVVSARPLMVLIATKVTLPNRRSGWGDDRHSFAGCILAGVPRVLRAAGDEHDARRAHRRALRIFDAAAEAAARGEAGRCGHRARRAAGHLPSYGVPRLQGQPSRRADAAWPPAPPLPRAARRLWLPGLHGARLRSGRRAR